MSDKHHGAGEATRDFDATTSNARMPIGKEDGTHNHTDQASGPASGPDRAGRDFDLTTPNIDNAGGANRARRPAPAGNNFDLTAMNIGTPDAGEEEEDAPAARPESKLRARPAPPSPPPPPAAGSLSAATGGRTPRRVWLAGGVVALLLAGAAVLFVLFAADPAFTLKVLEAPPGSRVLIDGLTSGVPQADGAIIVQGLKADESREVRVTHKDFDEWSTTVKGTSGEEMVITAKLAPKVNSAAAPDVPATEIDYHGPMVLIPAGSFVMGDNNHRADERPEHEVTLPAYYIDKYEVTNEQYKRFCDETGHARPPDPWWDERYFEGQPRSPVVGINWDDAAAYAKWAGKRLPKEEEWEKAAAWDPNTNRKRRWPWGDSPEQNRANLGLKRETLRLVVADGNPDGASAYGVYNMAGNVAEWTEAYYQPYEGNQTSNQEFGKGNRVMRGGACFNTLEDARTTRRLYRPPQYTAQEKAEGGTFVIGFRCAVLADDPKLQEHLRKRAR